MVVVSRLNLANLRHW